MEDGESSDEREKVEEFEGRDHSGEDEGKERTGEKRILRGPTSLRMEGEGSRP